MLVPQVHVRIRGQLAACSGNHKLYEDIPLSSYTDYCGFKYGEATTPTVTSITPTRASSYDTVTLSGRGFSGVFSENLVQFGDVDCTVTSSTSTVIECTLQGDSFGGFKPLHLHVLFSGMAETSLLGITLVLSVSGISPSEGSGAGGTLVTITGSGFYHAPSIDTTLPANSKCVSGWRNEVLIGDDPCVVVNSTAISLVVLTPKESVPNYSTYDLMVSVVCADNLTLGSSDVLSSAYSYNLTLTPSVLSISPASGGIQGGETVTISGSGFSLSTTQNQVFVSQRFF